MVKVAFLSILLLTSALLTSNEAVAARSSGARCSSCGAPGQTGSIRNMSGGVMCDDCASKNGGKSWDEDSGGYTSPGDDDDDGGGDDD